MKIKITEKRQAIANRITELLKRGADSSEYQYWRKRISWCQGYVSRKNTYKPMYIPYIGLFGTGCVYYMPSSKSTRYCRVVYIYIPLYMIDDFNMARLETKNENVV